MKPVNRRAFLISTAAGITGLTLVERFGERTFRSNAAWTNRMPVNPAIDNLRVVCCPDTTMVYGDPRSWTIKSQNDAVNTEKVHKDLDFMAQFLTQTDDIAGAWRTIFRKPASKEWVGVKVAIKVNCIWEGNSPRIAVIDKICRVVHDLGVPYENIYIYDGCNSAVDIYGTAYGLSKLPLGVQVVNGIPGKDKETLRKNVALTTGDTVPCVAGLADGIIDILVNITVNKAHRADLGGFTLTMKNHVGSMKFSCPDRMTLFAMNKSVPILGGSPVRQQLCIVDSIWAMSRGPTNSYPDKKTYRLVMGTFSPAVDYLVCRKIREDPDIMNCVSEDPDIAFTYLTEFGYTRDEIDKLDFIYIPEEIDVQRPATTVKGSELRITLQYGTRTRSVIFNCEKRQGRGELRLTDLSGRILNTVTVQVSSRSTGIVWNVNGKASKPFAGGMYVVHLLYNGRKQWKTVRL